MASSKKRRKSANLAKKQKQLQKGQFHQRDGDRRRRNLGMTANEALALKHFIQQRVTSNAANEEE